MVVALAGSETMREAFENAFVKQLEALGVSAVQSKRWLPDSTKVDKEALRPILVQNSITTVLISSIRGVEKDRTFQPAEQIGPTDNLFRNFDTYQVYDSSGQHETGSYVETTEYLLETNLFNTKTEKLSWSVTTRTAQTKDMKSGVDSVVSAVINQATDDNVF